MTTVELDAAKMEAFGGQMMAILNGGSLALMLSIGHRTDQPGGPDALLGIDHALYDGLSGTRRHGPGHHVGEQKAHQMMREAGFTSIQTARVEGDLFNNYYIATKG